MAEQRQVKSKQRVADHGEVYTSERGETPLLYTDYLDPRFVVAGFFDGWKKPLTAVQLRSLVGNSRYKVIAVDIEASKVVGIITALSDEVNWAFIPYLEVIPEYKNRGIGTRLLSEMLGKLAHINCVDLTCDESLQPFYEKFGMLKSHGMVIRRYLSE